MSGALIIWSVFLPVGCLAPPWWSATVWGSMTHRSCEPKPGCGYGIGMDNCRMRMGGGSAEMTVDGERPDERTRRADRERLRSDSEMARTRPGHSVNRAYRGGRFRVWPAAAPGCGRGC